MQRKIAAAVTGLAIFGCGGSNATAPATAHKVLSGIAVDVSAIDDEDSSKEKLGEDVTESFTPIAIAIENRVKGTFVLERRSIVLRCKVEALRTSTASDMFQTYKRSVVAGSVVAGPVGAASVAETNDEMNAEWTKKELPPQLMMLPGQHYDGMVYFEGRCPKGPRTVTLPITPTNAGDAAFQIDVSLP